jgi:LuxR family maltose regulon positive regulatory protein
LIVRAVRFAPDAEKKGLTVIKAPAGFGKTSLALTWLQPLRAPSVSVAWLSLDAKDDEPVRFVYHLASATARLRQRGRGPIVFKAAASLAPAQSIIPALINELVAVGDGACVFLDDDHPISLPAVQDELWFLIEHMPSNNQARRRHVMRRSETCRGSLRA